MMVNVIMVLLCRVREVAAGTQTELPRHAAQPTSAEELQCNRSAGERVGGGEEEERSPKHDKIRTNDSPHKPEMLVVF